MVELQLAPTMPNVIAPYTRDLLFEFNDIGVPEVKLLEHVIITGLKSRGAAFSVKCRFDFELSRNTIIAETIAHYLRHSVSVPSYVPMLILRNPPGDMSHSSFSKEKSTVVDWSLSNVDKQTHTTRVMAGVSTEQEVNVCAGGGFGVMVLACKNVSQSCLRLITSIFT